MNIYLDHAATTYLDKRVLKFIKPYFTKYYGNPSSQHKYGRDANKAVIYAKEQAANILGAQSSEVFLTSGGTESDNWAIKGVALSAGKGHIITTNVEHHAVLNTYAFLEKKLGFKVTYLPVDQDGLVSAEQIEGAIKPDTILISVMFANNETGVIMPIDQIAKVSNLYKIVFHTDAVQAVGRVPIDVKRQGIDMLSLSGHKIYGPKGIGALYIKDGILTENLMHGGGQERGLRAGTYNTAGAAGLGKALSIAAEEFAENAKHYSSLAKRLEGGLLKLPGACVNGANVKRLAGFINVAFKGIDAKALKLRLDLNGVAVSTGSSCASGANASHVLKAMGQTDNQAHSAIRFTIGRRNTKRQIDRVIALTGNILNDIRTATPFSQQNGNKVFV